MKKSQETSSYHKGIYYEDIACEYLTSQHHSIVSRNFTKKTGEIDIISLQDKTLHITEVKFRKYDYQLFYSISASKKSKVLQTLLHFLQENVYYNNFYVSFNAILISRDNKILFIENAWDENITT